MRGVCVCANFIWRECADTLREAEGEPRAVKNQLIAAHELSYEQRAFICDYDTKLLADLNQ
jgi:hypothetical protein